MKKEQRVSAAVVKRLPKYYRYLQGIASKGIIRVSSQVLSEISGLTASQIRQDLNHFGGFGQQGYGYNVEELTEAIEHIIGLDKKYNTVIVGVGNIGQALILYTGYKNFRSEKFALFDSDQELIGKDFNGTLVRDVAGLGDFVRDENIQLGIVTTPAGVAQEICDILVEGGVNGIWNFAPIDLELPEDVVLENVHLDESLYTLIYYINNLADYPGSK